MRYSLFLFAEIARMVALVRGCMSYYYYLFEIRTNERAHEQTNIALPFWHLTACGFWVAKNLLCVPLRLSVSVFVDFSDIFEWMGALANENIEINVARLRVTLIVKIEFLNKSYTILCLVSAQQIWGNLNGKPIVAEISQESVTLWLYVCVCMWNLFQFFSVFVDAIIVVDIRSLTFTSRDVYTVEM